MASPTHVVIIKFPNTSVATPLIAVLLSDLVTGQHKGWTTVAEADLPFYNSLLLVQSPRGWVQVTVACETSVISSETATGVD